MTMQLKHITGNGGYPPVLGLVGPLGCGKTTIADAIVSACGAERMSCARPIRDMLGALGVPYEATMKRKNEPIEWLYNKTPRSLLRSLGTEWGRNYVGPDIWINSVLVRARERSTPIVIDDVRFDNEARAIKAIGGLLFYISFPGRTYTYDHPSECGLRDWSQIDGVIGQSTGRIYFPPDCLELLPRRPWWAEYALGRKLFSGGRKSAAHLTPITIPANLAKPQEIGARVAEAWNDLLWTYSD